MNTKGPTRIFDHAPCQKKISNFLKISTITLQRDPQHSIRGAFFQSTVSSMKIAFTLAIFVLMETVAFSQAPILIRDIVPGIGGSTTPPLSGSFTLDSLYFFRAAAQPNDFQYWVTDGTTDKTHLLKSIVPQNTGLTYQSHLFTHKHIAYFVSSDNMNGNEGLWRTDGTTDNTYKFMDQCGVNCSRNSNNIILGDKVLFTGTDSLGEELWITDGSMLNTQLVKDILIGKKGSNPDRFIRFNNEIYFTADNNGANRELWRSDGTLNGTNLFIDLNNTDTLGSSPVVQGVVNNTLYFTATGSASTGRELWKTDGTVNGTLLVKDINQGSGDGLSNGFAAVIGNNLLFPAFDSIHGREWWLTDGTEGGTHILKEIITSNTFGSGFRILSATDSLVIFWVNDLVHGQEMWRTDGTSAGTYLLKDIYPGLQGSIETSNITPNIKYKNRVFFPALDDVYGKEIWETDGTTAGTKRLTNMYYFNVFGDDSRKENLQVINNYLYFTAATDEYGYEVWKLLIDTPVATQNPANPAQLNVEVYPNPNTGSFHFTGFLERPSSMQARLLDLQGRVLFTQQFEQMDGAFLRNIEAPQLPNGLYLLNIQSEQGTRTLPVSILKN